MTRPDSPDAGSPCRAAEGAARTSAVRWSPHARAVGGGAAAAASINGKPSLVQNRAGGGKVVPQRGQRSTSVAIPVPAVGLRLEEVAVGQAKQRFAAHREGVRED